MPKGIYKVGKEIISVSHKAGGRETVPSLTSDMGKKTVSVLAHSFFYHKGLTWNIFSPYPPRSSLEVSSVLRLKSVCYGMFCPLGLND